MQYTKLAKTLALAAVALLMILPGAMAQGSEESTSEADYNESGDAGAPDCGWPTNWVTIDEPFPTITIHWDCLPVIP